MLQVADAGGNNLLTWIGVTESIATVSALALGGVWAYYNYFRGRTYKPRLDLTPSAYLRCLDDRTMLRLKVSVKNAGLSKVELTPTGTGFRIWAFDSSRASSEAELAAWRRVLTRPILQEYPWVEPGETVSDEQLVAIPSCSEVPYRLEVRLVSNGLVWTANTVVDWGNLSAEELSAQQTSRSERKT